MQLRFDDPLAQQVTRAIKEGDLDALRSLLSANENLGPARIVDKNGSKNTLLHAAVDWPGHFPHVAQTIAILIAAGADVNARTDGKINETPLHGAASSNDVAALDALIDGGANLEARGAVLGGGTPLSDAVGFGNWACARRLVERGAKIGEIWHAAGLGRLDLVEQFAPNASPEDLTGALWCACWGGQRETAQYLIRQGANINWIGWDKKTPLDAAATGAGPHLVEWLRECGAKSTRELHS